MVIATTFSSSYKAMEGGGGGEFQKFCIYKRKTTKTNLMTSIICAFVDGNALLLPPLPKCEKVYHNFLWKNIESCMNHFRNHASQGVLLANFNDGGRSDRGSYSMPKKITTSEFVYPKKTTTVFSITKKIP